MIKKSNYRGIQSAHYAPNTHAKGTPRLNQTYIAGSKNGAVRTVYIINVEKANQKGVFHIIHRLFHAKTSKNACFSGMERGEFHIVHRVFHIFGKDYVI